MLRQAITIVLSLCITACDKAAPASGENHIPTEKPTNTINNKSQKPVQYVGSELCQGCHISEHQDWLTSDHHKAMMRMDSKNVLGNFSDQTLKHHQQQTHFNKHADTYLISTDQNTASAATLDLAYTFGIFPLQQYLTILPDGKIQSLPFAWDSRPATNGGQQWFHLYDQEKIVPGDVLHWRSASHNANFMCIECHSTDYKKNYNVNSNDYDSTWKEIGVGCESCHGPGSKHIDWVKSPEKTTDSKKGWDLKLTSGSGQFWQHQTESTKAQRTQPGDNVQIERCAQCHSRRGRISESNNEKFLMDAFLPSLLEESLYHPDGQIQDEVYEYGSFMQSKMANKGVTCSNCHNPHSGKIKIAGNGLCLQCHNAGYDSSTHTMHQPNTNGSFCVDCHMPTTTYMTVDARRDHSMRIPRPDLSSTINTPNACNNCHSDKTAQWPTEQLEKHAGTRWKTPHYGEVLAKARLGMPSVYPALIAIIHDAEQPAIVRATAISLLPNFPARDSQAIIADSLGNEDPLIRLAAVRAIQAPPQILAQTLLPLLQDQQRAIRIETARMLAGNPAVQSDPDFIRARQEYIHSQEINSDRASALTNLAGLAIQEQRVQDAENLLLAAIKIEPYYIPASTNLADLYRMSNRDPDGKKVLDTALLAAPDSADLNLAYALLLVREKKVNEAVPYLKKAVAKDNNPRFSYIYAIALNQLGKTEEALQILDQAAAMPSYDRSIHEARIEFARQAHKNDLAEKYIKEWHSLDPDDPAFQGSDVTQ